MPQQPCRGCHVARGSTLTSWRSGRLGRVPRVKRRRLARASCAEDGASGWGAARGGVLLREGADAGCGSIRLAQQQQVSQRSAWPSHAAPVSGASDRDRAGAILRNHMGLGNESWTLRGHRPYGVIGGEFDPGSGSTLAACLMHASRARTLSGVLRGGRVRNTWATCPGVGDSRGKPRVIPHTLRLQPGGARKTRHASPLEGPAAD